MITWKVPNAIGHNEILRKIASGSLAALGIKITTAGLTFLMFLVLARSMDADEFGSFGFSLTLATFIAIGTGLGLQTAVMKWVPAAQVGQDPGQVRALLLWGLKTSLAVSGMAAVLLGAAALAWQPGTNSSPYLVAAAALIVPLTLAEYLSGAVRAMGRVVLALSPKDIFWRAAGLGLGIYALAASQPVSAQYALTFLATVLAVLCLWQFVALARLAPADSPPSAPLHPRLLLGEAAPMWGAALLYGTTQHADVVLLGLMVSPDSVGPYFAAVRIANLLSLLLIASNMVAAPLIARFWAQRDTAGLQRMLRFIAIGISAPTILCYAMLILAGPSLLGWFGPGYETGYVPLLLIGAGFAFNAVCGPTGYVMQMTGLGRTYLRIMAATYAVVVFLQVLLIPVAGTTGAAAGALLGQIVWNLWVRRTVRRELGVDPTIFQLVTRN